MNDSASSCSIAWLAAADASPMRATIEAKMAKVVMSRNHWPPIGALVRRNRAISASRGQTGACCSACAPSCGAPRTSSSARYAQLVIDCAAPAPRTPQAGMPSVPKISPYANTRCTATAISVTTSGVRVSPMPRKNENSAKLIATAGPPKSRAQPNAIASLCISGDGPDEGDDLREQEGERDHPDASSPARPARSPARSTARSAAARSRRRSATRTPARRSRCP